jgi:hypothetical protein
MSKKQKKDACELCGNSPIVGYIEWTELCKACFADRFAKKEQELLEEIGFENSQQAREVLAFLEERSEHLEGLLDELLNLYEVGADLEVDELLKSVYGIASVKAGAALEINTLMKQDLTEAESAA